MSRTSNTSSHFSPLSLLFGDFRRRSLALGFALGMVIGLLPKATILVLVFLLALYFLRANLLCGLLSAAAFTFVSPFLDRPADQIGMFLLAVPAVQSFGSNLYEFPLGAWTMLHNSVVLGQLAIGVLFFLPFFAFVLGILSVFRIGTVSAPPKKGSPLAQSKNASAQQFDNAEVLYTVPLEYASGTHSPTGTNRLTKPQEKTKGK